MRQKRPTKQRGQAGFTLIELLIAATLLVVGVMAMSGLVALTVKNNGHSRLDSTATMINQALVEQVVSGVTYQSFNPTGTGLANIYDCGTHTIAATNPWQVNSAIGGAQLANGKIDFVSQASSTIPAGYHMDYVVCVGNSTSTYDVRWNISALAPTTTTSFTHILTVGARLKQPDNTNTYIINFPINMRVMLGPDPPKGS